MNRAELIARLEAVEGPSRELDMLISIAVGRENETTVLEYNDGTSQRVPWALNGWGGQVSTPHYTSSIDAALTLYRERPALVSTDPRQVCIAALKAGEKE